MATRTGNYDAARELIALVQGIDAIIEQADTLDVQLTKLFGEVAHSDTPRIPATPHGDVVTCPHHLETQCFKCFDDAAIRRIVRESGH